MSTLAAHSGTTPPPATRARAAAQERDGGRGARLAFVAVTIGVVTTGPALEIGGTAINLERIVGVTLTAAMGAAFARKSRPYPGQGLLYVWLGWIAVLALSAALTPAPIKHFTAWAIAVLPVAVYWLVASQRVPHAFVHRVFDAALWFMGVGGVLALALKLGLRFEPTWLFDNSGRLKLLTLEPNLFGSTAGFLMLVWAARVRWSFGSAVMLALVLIGFAACGSKMPYLAIAVCLTLLGLFRAIASRRGLGGSIVLPVWVAGLALAGGLLFAPQVQNVYEKALAREDAVSVRTYLVNLSIRRFEQKPILGQGPGDLKLLDISVMRQFGSQVQEALSIPNMFVAVLHDSGVIGFVLYMVFVLGVMWYGWRAIVHGSTEHCAYLAGFLYILLCSQATTVHLTTIFGLAAGLVMLPMQARPVRRPAAARRGSGVGENRVQR